MKHLLFALILSFALASCSSDPEPIELTQSDAICIDEIQQGTGFLSEGFLYSAEHVVGSDGTWERVGNDIVRNRSSQEGTSIPQSNLPDIGTEVTILGCSEYGSALTGEITVVVPDGSTFGRPGSTVILIDAGDINPPGGFSGAAVVNDFGWFAVLSGFDQSTNLLVAVVPN